MAYNQLYGEPGPAEWMQISNALRQKEMEALALREKLTEVEARYTCADPVEDVPFEVQMIHGALAEAEAQHAAYAASVHGMALGVTAPVPPPVPNPIIVEIGNAGDAEDDMPLAISGFGLSNPVKKGTDDSENEIDDTIAQPCKVLTTNDVFFY